LQVTAGSALVGGFRRNEMPRSTPTARRSGHIALGLGLWLAVCAALPATAEVTMSGNDGVKAGGSITNELQIKKLTTSAEGKNAKTVLRGNTIQRTTAGGDISNVTEIDELTLRADGKNAVSKMAVGTISDVEAGGDITNRVTVGTSTNVAIGAGARACTELGTLGGPAFCN
jgi:hypothetical protein